MTKKLEVFSKDENVMVVVDSDYGIREVYAYVPALDSWHQIDSIRLHEQAEKIIQDYIEENDIKVDDDCDDFGSGSYRRLVSNF